MPPLVGPKGVQYAAYTPSLRPGADFVLTNKASPEAQIAAIKLLDYLFTFEGFLRGFLGEEGKDWRKPEPGEVALNDKIEPLYFTIPLGPDEKPHNSQWEKIAMYYWPTERFDAWVSGKDVRTPEGWERKLQEATYLYDGKRPKEVFPHWAIWVDPAQADELAMLRLNITDYVNQNALQFVTDAKSIEKDWDSYVSGLDNLNLKRYLEMMQQLYDQTLQTLK
jgi:putative aldouronate transport system substrate-binding protein